MMSKLSWRMECVRGKHWWNVGDEARRYASREYSVMLSVHRDVWCKCEKAKVYAIDKNIFSDQSSFTMCIPRYDLVASTCPTDDIPTEADTHYTEVDFIRHENKTCIVAIREDKRRFNER